MSITHRIPISRGSRVSVAVGDHVHPDQELARRRSPLDPQIVPVAAPLRRRPEVAAGLLLRPPGSFVEAGEPIAQASDGRQVLSPLAGLLLAYSRTDGNAIISPLGPEEPILAHVSGWVSGVDPTAIVIDVPGAALDGVGGTGEAVHGELVISVDDPGEELRATAIDVGSTGKIVVGGSRASAETLTRARAMGVAGIVLGGVLDKELRDFEAIQRRRREVGGLSGSFGLLLVEGFGKVGLDAGLFAWFERHTGHMASLFGSEHRLYVYDAAPPPTRRSMPRLGDRVVAHRRPIQGRGGELVGFIEGMHMTASGIPARTALVRFEDGRTIPVPVANLEAIESTETGSGD
jgi:hypothetical protein